MLHHDPIPRPRPSTYDPAWERVEQQWAEEDAAREYQRELDEANARLAQLAQEAPKVEAEDVETLSDEELVGAALAAPEPLAPAPDPLASEPVLERSLFRLPRPRSILRGEHDGA